MTDHLEPYRRLARAIRFAPQLPQPKTLSKLTEPNNSVPPVPHPYISNISQVSQDTPVGPPPDPSAHIAELVRTAVSKHTVLPVSYDIQENIGDRISNLTTTAKPSSPVIILPKIPEPDPNWVPPTPVVTVEVAAETETRSQVTPTLPELETPPSVEPETPPTKTSAQPLNQPLSEFPEITLDVTSINTEPEIKSSVESTETPSEVTETSAGESQINSSVESTETTSEVTETSAGESQINSSVESTETPSEVTETAAIEPEINSSIESTETPSELIETSAVLEKLEPTLEESPLPETPPTETAVETVETPELNSSELEKEAVVTVTEDVNQIPETSVEDSTKSIAIEPPAIVESVAHQLKNAVDTLTQLSEQVVATATGTSKKSSRKQWLQEVTCPKCKSTRVKERGYADGQQKYVCKNCGKRWRVELEKDNEND